ncbi:hypothetical protein B0H12DRAFT_1233181 [Mycena haematopus]|nr:hypothetical protein B0H12DRAFT_1233181 [Mycena haematopus]
MAFSMFHPRMFRSCTSFYTSGYPLCQKGPVFILRTFVSRTSPKQKKRGILSEGPTEKMWAAIEPTSLSVFHNPNDSTSVRVLLALQAAIMEYPPRPLRPTPSMPTKYHGPLKLDVTVHERAPNADEFRLLLPLQSVPSFTAFLTTTAVSKWLTPTNSQALVDLISEKPDALNWPVVVDWEHGDCLIGGARYRDLLTTVFRRRKRAMGKSESASPPPTAPPPAEWIDYD